MSTSRSRQGTGLRRAYVGFLGVTALLAWVGAPLVARAQQNLSWDVNGATAGTGGTGAWNTSSAFWFNGATFQSWNNAAFDNAIFAGSAGAVTLATPINAHNLTFNVGGYTLTGSTLTFGGAMPTVTTSTAVTTINSALGGSTGFTKAGSATLAVGGNSTGYTGVTTVNSGSLRVNSANALGLSTAASQLVLNNGITFIFGSNFTHNFTLTGGVVNIQGGGIFTLSGSPTLTAATTLNFNGALTNATLSGNLADTGANVLSLTRNGTGRTVLSGTNSYTGATTVTQGRFQLGSAGALSAGSNLVFNGASGTGGTIDLTAASGNFTRSLGTGAGQVQWLGDGGFQASGTSHVVNIGGAGATLAWGSGGFVPSGSRLILGTDSNSTLDFRNGVDLSGGIRAVQGDGGNLSGHARMSGVLSGTGGLNKVGNGILELTAANTYSGGTTVTSGTLLVSADGNLGAAAGALTFDGGTLLNTGAFTTSRDVTINAGGGAFQTNANIVVNGSIVGAGQLTKTGASVLTLTGTNLYAGGTTIGAGTLQIGNGGTSGSIVGNVVNNGVLAFNRSDTSTFDGAISGAGSLEQRGAGTTVLTGANIYTGGTAINAGTLQIGNGVVTGNIVGNVVNNGVLAFNRSDAVTFGGIINGAGAVVQEGGGTLTLTGASSYAGGTAVNTGTVSVAADNNLGASSGPLWLDGGTLQNTAAFETARNVTIGAAGGTFLTDNNLIISGPIAGPGAMTKQGTAALTLTGDGTYAGGTTIGAGTLQLGNGGTSGSIIGNVLNNGALIFNRSDAVAFGGVISGTGAVAQAGGGMLTLTGTNSYSGGTVVTNGMVSVSADTNLGAASGPLTFNGGTLQTTAAFATARAITLGVAGGAFQTDAALLISSDISGPGTLIKQGADTLTLTGANAHTGGTSINAGALQIGNGGVIGSIVGNVANNGVLAFNRSDAVTFGGIISGAGAVVQNGGGTLTLTGASSYAGGTTVNNSTLSVAADDNLGASSGPLWLNGGTLQNTAAFATARNVTIGAAGGIFQTDNNLIISGPIGGPGALTKEGAAALTLAGEGTYSGGTTITAGTLQLGNGGRSGSIIGNVLNNGALIFNRSDAVAIGGVISGTGAVSQNGAGTTTLTAANSYTGGTSIAVGTLQIGNGGTSGSIVGNVVNNGVLAFNRSDTSIFNGAIAGVGRVEQRGVGTTILTSTSDYSGGTTINAGTLQIGNGGLTGSILGDVVDNGVLIFNRSDAITFGGLISGSGAVVQTGSGTLTLTGTNSYTGGTAITNGTVSVSADTNLGGSSDNISINGGTLQNTAAFATSRAISLGAAGGVFQTDANLFETGTISGAGALTKRGAAALILTGANTYTGGTTIDSGTLQIGNGGAAGSTVGNVLSNGTLIFNRSDLVTFGGIISGAGSLAQSGGGTVLLTADSSLFTGTTSVLAGVLAVDGSLGGTLDVYSGGRLQGTGTVGTTNLASGGTLAPGNPFGILTIAGDLNIEPGSTYEVRTDAAGTITQVHAAGMATITGGTVRVISEGSFFRTGARYTILNADGGVAGRFSAVTETLPLFDMNLAYGANEVYLDVSRNSTLLCSLVVTRNQCAVSTADVELGAGNPLVDAIRNLPNVFSIQRALDLLTGEVYASSKGALLENSRFIRDAALDRSRQLSAAAPVGRGAGFAVQEDLAASGAMWARAFGSNGHRDGDGNAARIGTTIGGTIAGFDAPITDRFRLGLAGGYSRSTFSVNERVSSASSDDFHLAIYGGAKFGPLGLRFGSAVTWHQVQADRSIAFRGYLDKTKADYSSRTAQVFGEAGYAFDFGRLVLEPYAQLAHVYLSTDSFTESGGAAALRGINGSDNVTYSTLGLHASQVIPFPGAGVTTARITVGWRYATGDLLPVSTLAAGAASSFKIAGVPIARDSLVVDAGVDHSLDKNFSMGFAYNGQIAAGGYDHGLRADFTWRF